MKAAFHVNPLPHQEMILGIIYEALQDRGVDCYKTVIDRPDPDADIIVMWSWRHDAVISDAVERGATRVHVERGFLPQQKEWVSLAVNGFNNRGKFVPCQDNGERAEQYFGKHLKPWKNKDGKVLIAGQHDLDTELYGVDVREWAEEMIKLFPNHIYRPHPYSRIAPPVRAFCSNNPLGHDLLEASAAITYASNISVETVLEGIPTVCFDKGSVAWDVCSHSIENLSYKPNREQWLKEMAWKQWKFTELKKPDNPIYDLILEEAKKNKTSRIVSEHYNR